jgi:hypothetical protein
MIVRQPAYWETDVTSDVYVFIWVPVSSKMNSDNPDALSVNEAVPISYQLFTKKTSHIQTFTPGKIS